MESYSRTRLNRKIFVAPQPADLLSFVNFEAYKMQALKTLQNVAPIKPVSTTSSTSQTSQAVMQIVPASTTVEDKQSISSKKCISQSFAKGVSEQYTNALKLYLVVNQEEFKQERDKQQFRSKGNEEPWQLFEIAILQLLAITNQSPKILVKEIAKHAMQFLLRRQGSIESALKDHDFMSRREDFVLEAQAVKEKIQNKINQEKQAIIGQFEAKMLRIKPERLQELTQSLKISHFFREQEEEAKKRAKEIAELKETIGRLRQKEEALEKVNNQLRLRIAPPKK